MKIKLAILESDSNYLGRIVSVFSTKYADKLEIYSFTDVDIAMNSLTQSRINVLIASDIFEINVDMLPPRCAFAYLVNSPDIENEDGQRAICKFQKADLIYKQILSIYSEKAGSISGLKLGDDSSKTVLFTSPAGGVGSSVVAASYAKYMGMQGKKTLYLNLEKFGSSDNYFSGDGQFDMSDVIFALKSKNTNLSLKLEGNVKQDACGVCFYSQPKLALDMMELTTEEIEKLINEIKLTGSYDCIVIDRDFGLDKASLQITKMADAVVWVSDGSEVSNTKLYRAYSALSIIDNQDESLINRLAVIYNRFSNKTSKILQELPLKNIGGAPRFDHASTKQIMDELCKLGFFKNID